MSNCVRENMPKLENVWLIGAALDGLESVISTLLKQSSQNAFMMDPLIFSINGKLYTVVNAVYLLYFVL